MLNIAANSNIKNLLHKNLISSTLGGQFNLECVMDTMSLELQSRDKNTKAKDLLGKNLIPVEFYGKGVENQSLQVDYQTFRKLFRVAGTNTVIELSVDGGSKKTNALVQDVTYHPATDQITHVDFINVRMDQPIHTQVPVVLSGLAPAVKELGGTLMHHLHEVDVKCLPKDLVHSIEVNVDSLVDFSVFIRVKDLKVSDAVELLNDPEDVVVTVVAPRVEEEVPVVAEGEEVKAEGGEKPESGEAAGSQS